ncbi:MAG: hypothetical protein KDB22_15035 [Planctomycetales bacterium]|nr:hypothetical protein [Planctomycetales bacterium]
MRIPSSCSRFIVAISLFSLLTVVQPNSLSAGNLADSPCGPDSLTGPLRKLIPQGSGKADWKPFCREHDACYDTLGADKDACDRRFFEQLKSSCACSGKPIRCRMTARLGYIAVKRFGDNAFDSAQAKARKRSGR